MLQKTSLKKVSILIIVIYLIAYFFPFTLYLIAYWLPFFSVTQDSLIVSNTFSYIIGALLMILLYWKTKKTATISIEKNTSSTIWSNILLGIGGIFGAMVVQMIVFLIESAITGNSPESQNTQVILESLLGNPTFILAIAIGGPIMEEFVFRRSIIGLAEPLIGFRAAAIVSAALFSVFHLDGHFFVYFFMGLFFTFLYKKTGNISTSIISHCGMNALVVLTQLSIQ